MNQNVKCYSYRQNPLLQTTETCIETKEKRNTIHVVEFEIQSHIFSQSYLLCYAGMYILDAEKIGNRKGCLHCLMLLLLLLLFGK